MIINLKKTSVISIVFLLSACSSIENSYNSVILKNTFDDNFSYTIENLNTLEDNKKLLKKIENDEKIFSLIKENNTIESPNYKFYLDYKMLKTKIAEREFIEKQKQKNKNNKSRKEDGSKLKAQEDHEAKLKAQKEHEAKLKAQKEHEAKLKAQKEHEEKLKAQKAHEAKLKAQKEHEAKLKAQKEHEAKLKAQQENLLNKFYKDNKKEIDHEFFILQSHCNEEDSYLLNDDIENIKKKLKTLSNNDIDKTNYILEKYKNKIDYCMGIFNDNKFLNPDI